MRDRGVDGDGAGTVLSALATLQLFVTAENDAPTLSLLRNETLEAVVGVTASLRGLVQLDDVDANGCGDATLKLELEASSGLFFAFPADARAQRLPTLTGLVFF